MAEWGNLCFCFLTISVFDNLSAIGLIAVSQPPVAVTYGCFDACGWWNDPQHEDLNSFPLLPRLILNMEFQNGSGAMSYIINPALSYSSIAVTMTHSFEFHVEVERWYVQQLANPSAHVTVGDRWKCHAGYLNSRSWTFAWGLQLGVWCWTPPGSSRRLGCAAQATCLCLRIQVDSAFSFPESNTIIQEYLIYRL